MPAEKLVGIFYAFFCYFELSRDVVLIEVGLTLIAFKWHIMLDYRLLDFGSELLFKSYNMFYTQS